MKSAAAILDSQYLEMRWRCLSLAADLDRVQRAEGGAELIASDSRLAELRSALQTLIGTEEKRAERVQLIFSDKTPAPAIS